MASISSCLHFSRPREAPLPLSICTGSEAPAGCPMVSRARLSRAQGREASKTQRRTERQKLGSLRGRRIGLAQEERYRVQVRRFFLWLRATGTAVPATVVEFDAVVSAYAEELWQEGEPRSYYSNCLCGLAHFVDGLRRRLPGAWRLHKVWERSVAVHL